MDSIGIIGGGQLGFYLGLAAHKMGYMPIYLDPNKEAICKRITNKFINKNFNDKDAICELSTNSKLITYEFENVDMNIIKNLYEENKVPQGYIQLEISNSRLKEKCTAKEMGIKVPKFCSINSIKELNDKIKNFSLPCILKTNSFGYDGKGQIKIEKLEDLKKIKIKEGTTYILEEVINFDYELSIIGVRGKNGEVALYNPIKNIHKNGILHLSFTKTDITDEVKLRCKNIITKFLIEKNIYGILCCELFIVGKEVYFNELAPRPHNSGHITMDTHITSQYENHLRAILGLPLGSTKIKKNGVMLNILGEDYSQINKYYSENTIVYDYKKSECREKRKMGHINYIGDDIQGFVKKIREGEKN